MYIKEMCQTILTKTDMNAIARLRGFDKQSLLLNQNFAKYFHSAIGLDRVLASLSDYEKVFLYCMGNEWVDVAFFAPLYKKASEELARKYDTFTQKYSETYKAILENLIRKGILVVRQGHGDSKLARLRFQVLDLLSTFLLDFGHLSGQRQLINQ